MHLRTCLKIAYAMPIPRLPPSLPACPASGETPICQMRPMRFGITFKMFLAVLIACLVISMTMGYAQRLSFENGFLQYVRDRDAGRAKTLIDMLRTEYALHGSWDFVRGHPQAWTACSMRRDRNLSWRKAQQGNRPGWPVGAPFQEAKAYTICSDRFPAVHRRPIGECASRHTLRMAEPSSSVAKRSPASASKAASGCRAPKHMVHPFCIVARLTTTPLRFSMPTSCSSLRTEACHRPVSP